LSSREEGASAIKRSVYKSVLKPIHLHWIRDDWDLSKIDKSVPFWFDIDRNLEVGKYIIRRTITSILF
jgi:hypothetical protein